MASLKFYRYHIMTPHLNNQKHLGLIDTTLTEDLKKYPYFQNVNFSVY